MEHTYHQLHKDTDIEKELLEKQIKEIEKKVERIEEKFINNEIQKDLFDQHIDKCKEE